MTQIPGPTQIADPNRSPVYSDHFYLSYQNVLFTSFLFRVIIYVKAFSNCRPINIYIYINTITLRHYMPLQKVQNNVYEFNSFDYKISTFKNAMYAHVRVYTYTPHVFSMTLRFLFLVLFPVHSIPAHS